MIKIKKNKIPRKDFGGYLSTAGAGVSLIPGFGQIAGPLMGLLGGIFSGANSKRKQREAQQKQLQQQRLMQEKQTTAQNLASYNQVLSTYPTQGVMSSGFYAKGGNILPTYKAENKEIIEHSPMDVPNTDNSGYMNIIASDMSEFKGDSHNADSGGIGASNNEKAFIYSNRIKVPKNILNLINRGKI